MKQIALALLALAVLSVSDAQFFSTLPDGTIVRTTEPPQPGSGQAIPTPVSGAQCAAANVFNACVQRAALRKQSLCDPLEASLRATTATSQAPYWECLCANAKEVAQCYDNCPNMRNEYTLQLNTIKSFCDAAKAHGGNPDVGIDLNGSKTWTGGPRGQSTPDFGATGSRSAGAGGDWVRDEKSGQFTLNAEISFGIALIGGAIAALVVL
ncbi:hypothetical protein BKA69DRAFT_1123748 [Paraphysoderma sedebokerense]|nr:hypothetical protein BKA69DRAFT_1123748 [Paraphysoderma sedebokerense]